MEASNNFGVGTFSKKAVIKAPVRTAVFTPRTLPSGELNPQHYGLGWRIGGLVVPDEQTGEEKIITLINHSGTATRISAPGSARFHWSFRKSARTARDFVAPSSR